VASDAKVFNFKGIRLLMVKLAIPKWVIALLVVSAISGTVLALQMFGQINISYVIQPTSQSPTLTPNPIQLDLGTINSEQLEQKTSAMSER